jgi:hypothetical protein
MRVVDRTVAIDDDRAVRRTAHDLDRGQIEGVVGVGVIRGKIDRNRCTLKHRRGVGVRRRRQVDPSERHDRRRSVPDVRAVLGDERDRSTTARRRRRRIVVRNGLQDLGEVRDRVGTRQSQHAIVRIPHKIDARPRRVREQLLEADVLQIRDRHLDRLEQAAVCIGDEGVAIRNPDGTATVRPGGRKVRAGRCGVVQVEIDLGRRIEDRDGNGVRVLQRASRPRIAEVVRRDRQRVDAAVAAIRCVEEPLERLIDLGRRSLERHRGVVDAIAERERESPACGVALQEDPVEIARPGPAPHDPQLAAIRHADRWRALGPDGRGVDQELAALADTGRIEALRIDAVAVAVL